MKLRIQGIGPHTDRSIEFDPTAVTTISGPSTIGKSTLMHAIAFALWSQDATGAKFDAGMISGTGAASFDGAGRRGTSRAIVVAGVATPGGTEEQFRAALPAHYQDPECAGLVMFPMRWVGLLEGAGSGLALRAALDRMLPGPTAADLLAELPKTAPREEKAAAALVTSYRRDANTARGRAQGLRAAVPTTPPPAGPSEEQVAAARAELDASAAAREDLAAWQVDDAEHRAGTAAVADWQRRRDAIVAPECERVLVTEELELAAAAEEAANVAVDDAVAAYRAALSAHSTSASAATQWDLRATRAPRPEADEPTAEQVAEATAALTKLGEQMESRRRPDYPRGWRLEISPPMPVQVPPPARPRGFRPEPVGACPGVKGCLAAARGEAEADRIAAEVEAEWVRHDEATATREAEAQERFARDTAVANQRASEVAAEWAAYDVADLIPAPVAVAYRKLLDLADAWRYHHALGPRPEVPPEPASVAAIYASSAQEALDTACRTASAWATHDARVEALGARPADPAPLRARPEAPDTTQATETIASAKRAADRLADHTAAVARAEAVASSAETDAAQAEALLATAEGWLVAVRSAPARALASKLALLGEGALQVLDVDGKTRVEINGRPWYFASHGERVAADAGFRLRLRAAAGLDALLVFVDDVTSVGGIEIPTAPGVVLLVTTAGGEMEVAVG